MEILVEGFPHVLPASKSSDFPDDPWERVMHGFEDWIDANFDKFVFDPHRILAEAKEYKFYGDGPSFSGVYFLLLNGKIEYIGKAHSIATRLRSHFLSYKEWTHYWCFGGIPLDMLVLVEEFYINSLRPPLNRKGFSRDPKDLLKHEESPSPCVGPRKHILVRGPSGMSGG